MNKRPQLTFAIEDPGTPDILPLTQRLDGYLAELYPTANIQPVALEELRQLYGLKTDGK